MKPAASVIRRGVADARRKVKDRRHEAGGIGDAWAWEAERARDGVTKLLWFHAVPAAGAGGEGDTMESSTVLGRNRPGGTVSWR